MNELAQKLFHDLRFDPHTRKHFNISSWSGGGTCGTVGCIAGTAILRAVPAAAVSGADILWSSKDVPGFDTDKWGYGHSSLGAYLLGLSSVKLAEQLFLPLSEWTSPLVSCGDQAKFIASLSHNERPDLSSVEKMVAWAKAMPPRRFHPTHCANALENVLTKERQYVDWAEAWCEA
jgi:hypothetical protein